MIRAGAETSIAECLLQLEGNTEFGARFVSRSMEAEYYAYAEVLARAKSVAGALQRKGLRSGDRVAILLPTSIQFLDAFLGIQLAAGVPAALYPPLRLGKLEQYVERTARMLRRIGARFIVTDAQVRLLLGRVVQKVPTIEAILDLSDLPGDDRWESVDVDPHSPAFVQFTSGSTADPRAVQVSHANLLHNLAMLGHQFRELTPAESAQGGVCWLPLYHDMGLVGCMYYGMYHPGNMTYIRPDTFLSKPQIWLQTLSRYKGVVSPAPNFAYGLCLSKVKDEHLEGVDLSHWKVALNGAEPITVDIMQGFCERFARWGFQASAMTPVYGLAEAVLAVSFADLTSNPVVTEFDQDRLAGEGQAVPGKGRRLPSVGTPMSGLEIRIGDDNGHELPEGRLGRIMLRGPSVTRRYFNDPEATQQVFCGDWLDTGDLGFMQDGHLYVSGRIKDLLIIRGRNIAPQEVEELLTGLDGLRPGCAVAVGTPVQGQGEQLIVLAERQAGSSRRAEDIERDIGDRILSGMGLRPQRVCILKPGTLPRTSSGKMQRSTALAMYLKGELRAPAKAKPMLVKELVRSGAALLGFRLTRKRRALAGHDE